MVDGEDESTGAGREERKMIGDLLMPEHLVGSEEVGSEPGAGNRSFRRSQLGLR